MANIAFIGLGNMGGPMAENLIKAGHSLTVYDLNKDVLESAVEAGAKSANSAISALTNANIVISMLPNGSIVKS